MRRTTSIAVSAAAMLMVCAGATHAADYMPNQVIVKYADNGSRPQRMALLHRNGVTKRVGRVAGVGANVVHTSFGFGRLNLCKAARGGC